MLSVELVKDAAEMARSLWREFHHYTEHASPQVAMEVFGRGAGMGRRRSVRQSNSSHQQGRGNNKTDSLSRQGSAGPGRGSGSGSRDTGGSSAVRTSALDPVETQETGSGSGKTSSSSSKMVRERFVPGVVPELRDATQMRVVLMEAWLAAVEGKFPVCLQLLR